jgi:hypothetical protein
MEPHASERIDLLITTDLLSEGVNLQDASVVVHLDLPWTSARMAQRVGRSRRLGALHSATSVYAFVPPAAADALLRQEQRLREKLHAAARLTGACGAILPVGLTLAPSMAADEPPAPARALELLRTAVTPWRAAALTPAVDGMLPVASVRAAQCGALALVRHEDGHSLVALAGARVSDRPDEVLEAAHFADGPDAEVNDDRVTTTTARLEAWLSTRAGATVAGIGRTITGTARRVAMRRIAHIAARTPLHHRAQVGPLAAEARRIVTAPYGVGAERILAELADAPLADEAWLRAVRAFGEANRRAAGGPGEGVGRPSAIEAVILFGP